MKNKKTKAVLNLLLLVLIFIGVYFVINNLSTTKPLSGSLIFSKNKNISKIIELDVSNFDNGCIIDFNGDIDTGSATIEVLDSQDNKLWSEKVNSETPYDNEIKVNNFNDKVKISVKSENATGVLKYKLQD